MLKPEFVEELGRRGYSRREFVNFCGRMVALLGLPASAIPAVAEALQQPKRPVLVWLEFQDCAGNTESFLRASHPTVAEFVLERFSLEYHETIMAAAGKAAEDNLSRVVSQNAGQYIVVVEGAIPKADDGVYCTIAGHTALEIARRVCDKAAAVIAIGACAWDGGLVKSHPNPTGAVGLHDALPHLRVLNLGGCPHNIANTAAVLVYYLTYKRMPEVDAYNRPLFAYSMLIHDQCERRSHYDAGQFVEAWGDEGHRQGWCLYKMGCKGPEATYNCPMVRWNDQTSWPIMSGHNCIACASPRFWDTRSPFYKRLPNVPGFGADMTAGKIGGVMVAAVAGATVVHASASFVRARIRRGHEPAPPSAPPGQTNPPPSKGT